MTFIIPPLSPSQAQEQLAHIHDDRSGAIIIAGAICLSMAIASVILRLIARRLSRGRSMHVEDYVIIGALLVETGEIVTHFISVHYGAGRHAVLLKQPQTFAQLLMVTTSTYLVAIATVKISVLLLYRRLFPNPCFCIILRITGGFIICYSLVQILLFIFQCRPIRDAWDPFVKAECVHVETFFHFLSAFNVLTGIIILCLPIPFIWQLQVSRKIKMQLMSIFTLGGLFGIISIYRLINASKQLGRADISYTEVYVRVWSIAEVCIGIVCACLPTYRPLFDPRVRWNSINRRIPTGGTSGHKPNTAAGIGSTGITVTESISIEMETCSSSVERHHNPNQNEREHVDFQTLVRSDWHSQSRMKV